MAQRIGGDRLHVFGADVVTAVQPGEGSRAAFDRDRCARAGTPAQPAGEQRAVGRRVAGRIDQRGDVVGHGIGQRQRQYLVSRSEHRGLRQLVRRGRHLDFGHRLLPGQRHDQPGGRAVRVIDAGVQHEAIELSLGQRVGAFLFDRVLRRHHHEQVRQLIGGHPDGDLPLGHRFEQRRLHLGGCAVDLVSQDQVVEQRPALEAETAFLRPVDVGAGEVGGQHVGGELHSLKIAFDGVCHGLHSAGLRQAGRAFDQQVTIGEQRHQQPLDQRRLTQHLPFEIAAQSVESVVRAGERGRQGHGRVSDRGSCEEGAAPPRSQQGLDSQAQLKVPRGMRGTA